MNDALTAQGAQHNSSIAALEAKQKALSELQNIVQLNNSAAIAQFGKDTAAAIAAFKASSSSSQTN
eukprot:1314513-Amorphochlora_amoeboformis.AAC.1